MFGFVCVTGQSTCIPWVHPYDSSRKLSSKNENKMFDMMIIKDRFDVCYLRMYYRGNHYD